MKFVIFWVVLMRIIPVLLLVTSGFALAACAGGAGGGLSGAGFLANNGEVCKIQQECDLTPTPPPTPPAPDSDGDGIPDSDEDDGAGDGTTGSGAGGNTPTVAKGNRTIALQLFALNKPTDAATAISQLSSTGYADMQAVEDAIMSSSKPTKLKFTINTNNPANNKQWAVPVEMDKDEYGTRDLRWIPVGHSHDSRPRRQSHRIRSCEEHVPLYGNHSLRRRDVQGQRRSRLPA
jgi:hypothetical protein